jgi:hypothetical protein
MAQNYYPLIFLVPWFVLVGITLLLIIQGWMIMYQKHGYTRRDYRTESQQMRRRIEELLKDK